MKEILGSFFKKNGEPFYFIARILIGLMFMMHGAGKLFGWFGAGPMDLMSLIGIAGLIEFFGGIMIMLGLFTRVFAMIGAIEMVFAYFMAHAGNGFYPILNGGELSLLYFAAFTLLLIFGSGRISVDRMIFGKECF